MLQILESFGDRLQILWCPSHEGVVGKDRSNDLANAGTNMAESQLPRPPTRVQVLGQHCR